MGAFLSLDESQRIMLVRFEGIVTDEVLLSRYELVREWLATHGYYSSISDFSEVSSFQVTARGVALLAASSPLVPDDYLRIVLAPQDEVFGMTRMFEMLGSATRNRVHVVRSRAEAYRLAGVESLDLRPLIEW